MNDEACVELLCGVPCSGKTTYAKRWMNAQEGRGWVLLSCDEALFKLEDVLCDDYDAALERVKAYLLDQSVSLVRAGCGVLLDWGFWQRAERERVSAFYAQAGIACRWHYIDVSPEEWMRRCEKRNAAVRAGEEEACFVDEGLRKKVLSRFEKPERDEIDAWVESGRA